LFPRSTQRTDIDPGGASSFQALFDCLLFLLKQFHDLLELVAAQGFLRAFERFIR